MKRAMALSVVLLVLALASPVDAEPERGLPHSEPPPETLIEPPPANETQRLIFAARESRKLCDVIASLGEINEPHPARTNELIRWAFRYHAATTTLDPRSKVHEPGAKDPDREIDLPADMFVAVQAQRRSVYAYLVRVTFVDAAASSGLFEGAERQRRLDDAWVRLVGSSFSGAHRYVEDNRGRYCNG